MDKLHFIEANPEGSYKLELADLSERAVAAQLCRIDAGSGDDLMRNIKLNNSAVKSCKGAKWPDSLPMKGVLEFDFLRHRDPVLMPVLDANKLDSFEAEFRVPRVSEAEKYEIVSSFAPYSYLLASQIVRLLHCFSVGTLHRQ